MAAAYLNNRTPHKVLKMETPFKMLHGKEADLSHLRVIGARTFVHIKDSRKLDAAAWEGKVCAAIARRENLTESGTQRLTASWRAGTSPSSRHRRHLLPPPSKLSLLQELVPPSWEFDDDTLDNHYISYGDLLRGVGD